MATRVTFNEYTGWVDITDPDNIPPDARLIGAADLLRYENYMAVASTVINEHDNRVGELEDDVASLETTRIDHESRLDTVEASAAGSASSVTDHDTRLVSLETWKNDFAPIVLAEASVAGRLLNSHLINTYRTVAQYNTWLVDVWNPTMLWLGYNSGWKNVGVAPAPLFQNGFENFGTPYQGARYVRHGDVVYLEGMVKRLGTGTGAIVFNLPTGFRPANKLLIMTAYNDVPGRLHIYPDGNVELYHMAQGGGSKPVDMVVSWASITVSFNVSTK
jgi:hypothetical protein